MMRVLLDEFLLKKQGISKDSFTMALVSMYLKLIQRSNYILIIWILWVVEELREIEYIYEDNILYWNALFQW